MDSSVVQGFSLLFPSWQMCLVVRDSTVDSMQSQSICYHLQHLVSSDYKKYLNVLRSRVKLLVQFYQNHNKECLNPTTVYNSNISFGVHVLGFALEIPFVLYSLYCNWFNSNYEPEKQTVLLFLNKLMNIKRKPDQINEVCES